MTDRVPDTPAMRRVERSFHPGRSGNVFIVQSAFWYLHSRPSRYAAMHGSPYRYDTHVPIIIASRQTRATTVPRLVGPEDIVPTIALMLGIEAPSGCVSEPLEEVLHQAGAGVLDSRRHRARMPLDSRE